MNLEKFFLLKFIANNKYEAGKITISTSRTELKVTYKMSNGWVLDKSNLFLGNCNDIPKKANGFPNLGLFQSKTTHSPSVSEYSYTLPLSSIRGLNCVCLVSHGIVTKGALCLNAWGEGEKFKCNNWATFSKICNSQDQDGGSQ